MEYYLVAMIAVLAFLGIMSRAIDRLQLTSEDCSEEPRDDMGEAA
ncbi:MAG TPA: hypothetical protein VHS06_08330 [Chloroflexota bacterium]|nr:hypothetical protein [Chloroflexota bacterium]